jgi:phosphoglycolate phosphatase-like HAD superfamily hydrolase
VKKRVLALDFDGVIWDSAGECYQTGWRAYKELTGRVLDGREYERGFLRGRPLARNGHDFYVLFALMDEDPSRDLAQMPHSQFVKERSVRAEQASKFDRVFYLLRSHIRDTQQKTWFSWQKPYPELLKLLDKWEDKFSGLALATTKDTASAQALLNSTKRFWPVFGKEFSEHKADQILGISQHYKVAPSEVLFIDDLLENLHQVKPTGAKTALADWGYNLPDSWAQAKEEGFPVVTVAQLEDLFQDFLEGEF